MKKLWWGLCAFSAAGVATVNLTRLVETNSNYEAAWWKVAAFVALYIFFNVLANEKTP